MTGEHSLDDSGYAVGATPLSEPAAFVELGVLVPPLGAEHVLVELIDQHLAPWTPPATTC